MCDHCAEFQQRRSEVWRYTRRWSLGVLPGIVVLPISGSLERVAPILFWAITLPLIGISFSSAFMIVKNIRDRYKCPGCDKLVTEADGIALDPIVCPHCGTRLKD